MRFQHGTPNTDEESCDVIAQVKRAHDLLVKPLVQHYLLGNNRIGENDDGRAGSRVAALARLIHARPDMTTWFLAGNELDKDHIKPISEALAHSGPATKYVWLKMNPIKTGTYHLAKTLMLNPHIELLDLFNCGVCNDGIAAFLRGLEEGAQEREAELDKSVGGHASSSALPQMLKNFTGLKHLYLDINAIDANAAPDLRKLFLLLGGKLESLYLNVNPIGDAGAAELFSLGFYEPQNASSTAFTVPSRPPLFPHLKRACFGSLGLSDASLPLMAAFVKRHCPRLIALDFSSYKSTNYFHAEHNDFTEAAFPCLLDIAAQLKKNAICTEQGDLASICLQHCFQKSFAVALDNSSSPASLFTVELNAFVTKLTSAPLELSVDATQKKTHETPSSGSLSLRNRFV